MARLEYIRYQPHRAIVGDTLEWGLDPTISLIDKLPQIYWADACPWSEANLWASEMARNGDVKLASICSLMEHLYKYAKWLETEEMDWRHFPQSKADRVLVRYRGALIRTRDAGELSPSTTTSRMRAVIRFYRYCEYRGFVSRVAPKWQEKVVVIRYFDCVGFERSMRRATTDLSIPNRTRPGATLEDGLLPLMSEHMLELLRFAEQNASEEMFLMLMIGFFTGARLGTIATLRLPAIEQAVLDPKVGGMWVLPIGPGTGVATKFDVSGDLLIPDELMRLIKAYGYARRHIDRVIKANKEHKPLLFLTRQGKPFKPATVDREMVDLRRSALKAGLRFMQKFKFHQSRATFGTWLMTIALKETTVKLAIEFVMRAMHHQNERTTFRYVRFLEHSKAKIEVANAFSRAFLGLKGAHE